MDRILTVPEAAEQLRVSRSTIWRWCKDGTLSSAFKIGRNWRIHRAEVEKIIGQEPVESDRKSETPDSVPATPSELNGNEQGSAKQTKFHHQKAEKSIKISADSTYHAGKYPF